MLTWWLGVPLHLLTINLTQSTSPRGLFPNSSPPLEIVTGSLSFILGWKRSSITQREGENGREVIWTKLPPDATSINPESNTHPLPLSLSFMALTVVTFAIYPQFLLILFGLITPSGLLCGAVCTQVCIASINCICF